MTRLRDDGYLEIGAEPRDDGDAIAAACFIKQEVQTEVQTERFADVLAFVGDEVCLSFALDELEYPILIPAKTAAEVVDTGDEFSNLVLGSIGMYEHPTYTLNDWLRAHTEEKA